MGVPKWHLQISPPPSLSPCGGGGAVEAIRGVWGASKAAFGSSAGKEQRSSGYYFYVAEKPAVLGWQRETKHRFKVKLQWLWPKNQKNNPMRVIQSIRPRGPGGGFSFVSLPKPRARSWPQSQRSVWPGDQLCGSSSALA